MQRFAIEQLKTWHRNPRRKPLLLMGARQVGKTWLMQEFGRQYFKHVAYIRFDYNERARNAFSADFDIKRILESISIIGKCPVDAKDTLILLDEIQECPAALTSLKYFCEEAREYAIIAAGSLLGVADHVGTGFPVGKVDRLDLYPMSFREFLVATGNESLARPIEKGDWSLINTFAGDYIHLLRTYFYVGGMPEAVDTYISTRNYTAVRDVQQNLLSGYRGDFSKHAPSACLPNMNLLWESIPQQLAKENKRFVYSEVLSGARRKTFEYPLRWLQDAGLIHPVPRIKTPKLPMSSYWAGGISKVFFVDVGLLGAVCDLDAGALLDGNLIFDDFKGALTEQYVQQELRATCALSPCYWASEEKNAKAEIDFLCSHRGNIIPIEVKSGINTQAKSLKTYCQRFQPRKAIRTSLNPQARNTITFRNPLYNHPTCDLLDIPLFAISRLKEELDN